MRQHPFLFLALAVVIAGAIQWLAGRAAPLEAHVALAACLGSGDGARVESAALEEAWLRATAANCRGETAVAEAAWREALAESPRYVTLLRASRPGDVGLAALAVAEHPEVAAAHFWHGGALAAAGEAPGAIAAYERGLALNPSDGRIWVGLGRLYEAQGAWETAVAAYERGCELVDQGKNGCPSAGRLYLAHGMYELAAQRYRQALVQLPGWPPARRGLAEALLALGQTTEARPHLEALAAGGDGWAATQIEQMDEGQ